MGEGCPFPEPFPLFAVILLCLEVPWSFWWLHMRLSWAEPGLTPLKCLSPLCHWILMDFCVWYTHIKKKVTFSISIEGEFCPRLSVPPELLICVRGLQISFQDSLMTIIFGKSHRGFIWMLKAMASVPDGELVQKSTDRGHGWINK